MIPVVSLALCRMKNNKTPKTNKRKTATKQTNKQTKKSAKDVTPSIAWRREAWKDDVLDCLP